LILERERKRRGNFRERGGIHQFERLAGVIEVFLQHPTGSGRAVIGEADAEEIRVDDEFLLGA
jgi:hypothetical protein